MGASWTPAKTTSSTTDQLVEALQKGPFSSVESVRITRKGRGGDVEIGVCTVEHDTHTTPDTVADTLASYCEADAKDEGTAFRYKFTISGRMPRARGVTRRGKTSTDDEPPAIGVLGVAWLNIGKADETEVGGSAAPLLRELAGWNRSIGDAAVRLSEAHQTTQTSQGQAMENLVKMTTAMIDLSGKNSPINEHSLKLFELQAKENADLRERQDQAEERRSQREADIESEKRTWDFLGRIGSELGPSLKMVFGAVAFKIKVDAAVKAKDAGLNIDPNEQPKPDEADAGAPASEPPGKVQQTLRELMDSIPPLNRANIAKAIGEDAWSVLKAAYDAPDERRFTAIIDRLKGSIMGLGESGILQAVVALKTNLDEQQFGKLEVVLLAAGIKFTE